MYGKNDGSKKKKSGKTATVYNKPIRHNVSTPGYAPGKQHRNKKVIAAAKGKNTPAARFVAKSSKKNK